MKRATKTGKNREFQAAQIQKVRARLAAEFSRSAPAAIQKFNAKGKENNYIDWKRAAEALQSDYTSVEFDGVTYWVR